MSLVKMPYWPFRHLLVPILSSAWLLAGCAPPPVETARVRLSITLPDQDPGKLIDGSIAPPSLVDLRDVPAPPVATSVSHRANQLVQQRGSAKQVEIVPAPEPDRPASEPVPAAKTAGAPSRSPELIPAPEGVPEGKMVPAEGAKLGTDSGEPAVFPDGGEGPEDHRTWPTPDVALVVTGNQHGYIEPCGCTGLDRQKGGMARRFTFLRELRDQGWPLVPIDAGNQVRRFGRQAEVKLQQTVKALKAMDYQAVGFGPEDVRLGVGELLAVAAGETAEDTIYVSANVVLIDPSLMPQNKMIEKNGMNLGITSVLDPDALEIKTSDEILVEPKNEAAKKALAALGRADFKVLMFFGEEEAAEQLARDVPGFDLMVVAGGYGEPTYRPAQIDGSETRMIVTGNKGMYAGVVGIYTDAPIRYARVPLTHEFEDAPEMRQLMAEYQDQLRDIGLGGLGLLPPIPNSSGQKFIGTAKCGECHKTAHEIWEGTPHAHATDSIVKPPKERGDIARHFDPECISCHVTGWNPQEYYPYQSGYLSLDASQHLTGNGCENCHGPGSEHAAAEADGSGVAAELRDQLRNAMKLPLEKAREQCMKCHDLDNSPDFHDEDAFEDVYWPEVEHYGVD